MTDHKFPWKWTLKELSNKEKNGLKVFSCFSCGGGSSMGYKLAGFDVIGNCEIDPKMMKVYQANHHPKYSFLMDIRDLLKQDLPDELRHLDILDGSPPCTPFSTAGAREKFWDKEKKFKEGQKTQKLDDLFFWFIEVARELQPKVVIAENVTGLVKANARGYVNEILHAFDLAGYNVQMFIFNSASMGVPQKRERVFFIAQRKDLNKPKLSMSFKEKPIYFKEVRSPKGKMPRPGDNPMWYSLMKQRKPTDLELADINIRLRGKKSNFNTKIWHDNRVCQTLTSSADALRYFDGLMATDQDYINVQTFPQDYDFKGESVKYMCGMSVPPVMMAQIASEVYEQWFK